MAEGNEPNPNGNLDYFIDTETITITTGTTQYGGFYYGESNSSKFTKDTIISATVLVVDFNYPAFVYIKDESIVDYIQK